MSLSYFGSGTSKVANRDAWSFRSDRDIVELVTGHRPAKATYSKDATEVAGGLRSYIIIGEKASTH